VRRRRIAVGGIIAASATTFHENSHNYTCSKEQACDSKPRKCDNGEMLGEAAVREDTWVLADFSSINVANPADWRWLLGNGAAALQSLAVPLPTLTDLAKEINGDSRTGNVDASHGAAPGDNQELQSLPRAVAAVVRAATSGRYLLPGADMALVMPYCGPPATGLESTFTTANTGAPPENARALCDAAVDVFNDSETESKTQSRSTIQWAPGTTLVHFATHASGTVERITDRHGTLCRSDRGSSGCSTSGTSNSNSSKEHADDCSASLTPSMAALAAFIKDAIGPTDARRAAEATTGAGNEAREGEPGGAEQGGGAGAGISAVHLWSAVVATTTNSHDDTVARRSRSGAAPEVINHGDNSNANGGGGGGAALVSGTLVINLARRPDRWQQTLARVKRAYERTTEEEEAFTSATAASGLSPLHLERLEAIDGTVLLSRMSDSEPISLASAGHKAYNTRISSSSSSSSALGSEEAVEDQEEASDHEDEDPASETWWLSRAAVAEQFRLGPSSSSLSPHHNSPLRRASSPFWGSSSNHANEALAKERALPPPVIMNPYEDHGWRPSVIGCALSHMKAWRQIAAQGRANPYASFLVLPDLVKSSNLH